MSDFLLIQYPWVKAFHVISVIAWMAGLFYLPRLYVYHVEGLEKRGVSPGSQMDLLFRHQERLLLRAIMNPAMIASWLFGVMLVLTPGVVDWSMAWPWTKAAAVIAMTGFHMVLARARRRFDAGGNRLSGRQWRMMNELPTVFMVIIVIAVIVKF
ncbi:MAG TPA: CopD family protein [Paenirhodobacter sp.]